MLSINDAWRIGRNKCVDVLGKELCEKYKNIACGGHDVNPKKEMRCWVGFSPNASNSEKISIDEVPLEIIVNVYVNMKTGATRVGECVLPPDHVT